MTTMKTEIDKANAANLVIIKIKKEELLIENKKLAQAVRCAADCHGEKKEATDNLKGENAIIIEAARKQLKGRDAGTATFIVNGLACKVTLKYECVVPEGNVEKMAKLLGNKYKDMVNAKTKYTGNSALIKLASDADDPLGKKARKLIVIKEGAPSVTFDASKN